MPRILRVASRYAAKKRSIAKAVRRRYKKYRSMVRFKPVSRGYLDVVRKGITAYVYNNAAGTAFETNSGWLTIGSGAAQISTPPGFANYKSVPFAATFRVSDMYNWTELQAIAEKVKLKWVKITVSCSSTVGTVNGLGQVPTLYYDTSADDDSLPTLPAFKEQMGIKRKVLANGRSCSFFIRPKMINNINSGIGGVNALGVMRSQYLNTDSISAACEQYGLNGFMEDLFLGPQTTSNLAVKFDIEYGIRLVDIK